MAFRADEAARVGYEQVEAYLVPRPRDADEAQRARSKEALRDIVDELGSVVDAYVWPYQSLTACGATARHKAAQHLCRHTNLFAALWPLLDRRARLIEN